MKNKENWKESKFVKKGNVLRASRNPNEVGYSSRLIVDMIANFYTLKLKAYARGNLLDLGCGKVPLWGAYKEYVSNNTCVDWNNSKHNNEYLDKYSDLNSSLELEDDTYDTILLSDVLEHIKNPRVLWKEMARVLKANGTLILNVPFYYWLHEDPHDYFRYTKYALNAMAEEAGFEVIEIEALGGAPEVLADISAKVMAQIPIIGRPIAIAIQSLTWIFIKTTFGLQKCL